MDDAVNNLVQAQGQLDLTRLPLFHGVKEKDLFSPEQWIDRVKLARAQGGGWNDEVTMGHVHGALRMKAIDWWQNQVYMNRPFGTFNEFERRFLSHFSTTKNVNTTMAMIQELKQKPGESVEGFVTRINRFTVDLRALNVIPGLPNPVYPANLTGDAGWAALNAGHLQQAAERILAHGVNGTLDIIKANILMAGLKPSIANEVFRERPPAGYASMFDMYEKALIHEKQQAATSNNTKAVSMLTLEEEKELEHERTIFMNAISSLENLWDTTDEDEYDQVVSALTHAFKKKTIRFKKFSKFVKGGNKSGTNQAKFQGECFFCKKRGHMKKDCKAFKQQQGGPRANATTANNSNPVESNQHNFNVEFNPYAYVRDDPQMQAQLSSMQSMHLNY